MKRLIASNYATCEDCKHGSFSHFGGSYWEPPDDHFECGFDWDELPEEKLVELKLVGEDIEDIQNKAFEGQAEKCLGFDPIMINRGCANCKEIINTPQYKHHFFSYHPRTDSSIPVCSQKCKEAIDEKINDDEKIESEIENNIKKRREDHI